VTAARAAGLAALALLAPAPAVAKAGQPGSWTRITGGQPVPTAADVGAARTPDGVLHLLWPRQVGGAGFVLHGSLSANARRLGPRRLVTAYAEGVNDSVALVAAPGGLRAFFAGLEPGSPADRVLATASSGGGPWSAAAPVSSSSGGRTPFAAAGIAAALGRDGTPIAAWGSPGSGFHIGLDPGAPDGSFTAGDAAGPAVGVDSITGQVVVGWSVVENGAVAAVPVAPIGARLTTPGPRVAEPQHRLGVSGRIGAPGVYVAYLSGGNQFSGRPALWRFGQPRARRVSSEVGARDVSLAAAPGGRLWVFWHRDGRLYATRSDPAASRIGATLSLALPRGTRAVHDLAGEGSRGPLDLLALVARPRTGTGVWHRRVLPGLTLAVRRAARGRVTLRVTDAGVPVRGAGVRIRGGRRRTGARGTATLRPAPGRHRATASKRGYAPASLRLRVR
jgi:hypothetical protein